MSETPRIKIGDWTATPALDILERDGQIVKLQPRAMELLVYLAGHANEVVSAEELIKSVWRGRAVGDGAVYRSVNQLRHALGDAAEYSRYIQTIPKRGYRLIASVERLTPAPEPDDVAQGLRGQASALIEAALPILQRALPFAATMIVTAGVTALAVWFGLQPEPRPVTRFEVSIDQTLQRTGRPVIALSPDGRHLIYNTQDGIYLRTMGELEARVIPGTEEDLAAPFFSPDGQSVAYWARRSNQLKRIDLSGGTSVPIANDVSIPYGASWAADGTILFGQHEGIFRVSADGGTPELVIPSQAHEWVYGPQLLPDGDSVLFSIATRRLDWDGAKVVVESLSSGERVVLIEGGSDARYLPTGHLVYAVGDELIAAAFDIDTVTVSSSSMPLLHGLARAWGGMTATANYSVANDGTLAYLVGDFTMQPNRTIVSVDRVGRETPLVAKPGAYGAPRLSPDGRRLAVQIVEDGNADLWIYDLILGTFRRLTFGPSDELDPLWTPDGERVAFYANGGIYWKAADGSGQIEPLVSSPSWLLLHDFSPKGEHLVFGQFGRGWDLHVLPMHGDRTGRPLIAMEDDQGYAKISPNGRWIAYASASPRTYRGKIYVRPFPDVEKGGGWQVSNNGGIVPRWGPDGKELFFTGNGSLFRVSIESEPTFSYSEPEALFSMSGYVEDAYSVSPDGQQFIMLKVDDNLPKRRRPKIIVVQNWFEELGRVAPASGISQATPDEH